MSNVGTGCLCGGGAFRLSNLGLTAAGVRLHILHRIIVGSVGADKAINVSLSQEGEGEECGQ